MPYYDEGYARGERGWGRRSSYARDERSGWGRRSGYAGGRRPERLGYSREFLGYGTEFGGYALDYGSRRSELGTPGVQYGRWGAGFRAGEWQGYDREYQRPRRRFTRGFAPRAIHTYDLDYGRQSGGPSEYSGRAGYSEWPRGRYQPSLEEGEWRGGWRTGPTYEERHWSTAEPTRYRRARRPFGVPRQRTSREF